MKITKKKIAWGIVLLILIAGGVICKIRWKVWFHNIPEIRYVEIQPLNNIRKKNRKANSAQSFLPAEKKYGRH